jgi:hypothetical protein
MKPYILFFTMLALGACSRAPAAPAAQAVLGKPHMSTYVAQARQGADGNLCIVGQTMDPDGDLRQQGLVTVYSPATNQIVWQQTVDAPDDNAALRFVACRAVGKDVYVAANVDTHSEQSLNQGLVWVYRFGTDGKLMASRELVTGARNAFAYDIDADAGGVAVAGRTGDLTANAQSNGIFFARLDPALRTATLGKLATGAYVSGSVARLNGNTAYLGGNFAPGHAAADVLADDYAVSKIVSGKYQFSVRPQKGKAEDIATAITPAGEIVSLGYAGTTTHLTVVGQDGKLNEDVQVASAYCRTGSASADATTVYAVRSACGRSQDPSRLVAMHRKTGAEAVVKGIAGAPAYVLALDDRLVVISRKGNGSLVVQTVAKGQ